MKKKNFISNFSLCFLTSSSLQQKRLFSKVPGSIHPCKFIAPYHSLATTGSISRTHLLLPALPFQSNSRASAQTKTLGGGGTLSKRPPDFHLRFPGAEGEVWQPLPSICFLPRHRMLGRERLCGDKGPGDPAEGRMWSGCWGGGLWAPPSSVAGSQPPEPGGRKRPTEAEGGQLAHSAPFSSQSPGCGFIHSSSPRGPGGVWRIPSPRALVL